MTDETAILKKRLMELAEKAYQRGVYTRTGFLSMHELSVFSGMSAALSFVPARTDGGYADAERRMVQFGSEALCGYDPPMPIACVEIRPRSAKFSEPLTHRDFLGALMNLGVERGAIGDIVLSKGNGYVFCAEALAPFLMEQLTSVRRTPVDCALADAPPEAETALIPERVQLSSLRLDALIAKAYRLNRKDAAALFAEKRVFINSRPCEKSSAAVSEGDVVSVRGMGRFVYRGVSGQSRKGKLIVCIEKYGG